MALSLPGRQVYEDLLDDSQKLEALNYPHLEEGDMSYLERFVREFSKRNAVTFVIRSPMDVPASLQYMQVSTLKDSWLYDNGGEGTMQRAFTDVEKALGKVCDEEMWERIAPRFGRFTSEDNFVGFFIDLR